MRGEGDHNARKGSQCCSPHLAEEGEVLGCFELIVFGTFCVCQVANSGAICLCFQPRSPGINSFLLRFLKKVWQGAEREIAGRPQNILSSEEEALPCRGMLEGLEFSLHGALSLIRTT